MKLMKSKEPKSLLERVRELAQIERQYKEINTLAAAKLTPAAYVREAWQNAGNPPQEHREKVRDALLNPNTFNASEAAGAYRRAIAAIRSVHFPSPPRELRRLNHLLTAGALAELAALNASSFDLFALAAETAAEKFPDDFGTSESTSGYERRLLELALKRDAAAQAIESGYDSTDLEIGKPDQHGNCRVTFAMTNGEVALGPNAAERLAAWVMASE